jgi:hypothetical protein
LKVFRLILKVQNPPQQPQPLIIVMDQVPVQVRA